MRVVIAGAGAVGTFLAEDLSASGHEVLVIERDPYAAGRLRERAGHGEAAQRLTVTTGDACEVDTLHACKLDTADVVVAATGDDEDNLVVSLLAKQEFAVPRVIARVNHPKNHWLFTDFWGVDVAVSTPHLLSALVEEAVSVGSLVRLFNLEGSSARLVEITLAEDSPATRATIGELLLPREATVVAVVRDGHVVVPHSDTHLHEGDEVLLLVTGEVEDEVRSKLVAP